MREALLARLDRSLGAALTIIQSPAGFGKTVLLGQWFERSRARDDLLVGWLTLDEDDREVTRFLANLATALDLAGLPIDADLLVPAQSFSDVTLRRDRICEAIERQRETVVLVLDDYHRATAAETDAVLTFLLRSVTSGFHLVMSTRDASPLKVANLEAQGLVSRIGSSDLALDLDAARSIFTDQLDDPALAALHNRTEGWPVALQLAKLWLDRDPTRHREIAAYSGRTETLARYLAEQVLLDLDDPRRDFLLDASILESFDANLVDEVRGRQDSRQLLFSLASFDALLVPLDAEHRSYRFHHLFAEFLGEQLRLKSEERARTLHERAARSYADRGETAQAVRHSCAAGDIDHAVSLVRDAGGWELVLRSGIGAARGLLQLFDRDVIAREPVLLRIEGYLEMKFGALKEARRLIDAAALLSVDVKDRRDGLIVDALLRTYADDLAEASWHGELSERVAELPKSDVLGRGTLHAALAVAALGRADFPQAEREASSGVDMMMAARSPLGEAYCRFHLAQSEAYRGNLAHAEHSLRTTLVAVEEKVGGDRALKAVGNGLLGHVLHLRGQTDEARLRLANALPAIEAHDSWLDVLSVSYGSAIALHREAGEFAAALELVDRCGGLADARALPELKLLARAWRVETLIAVGNTAAASDASDAKMVGAGWRAVTANAIATGQLALRLDRSADALRILRHAREGCVAQCRVLDLARLDMLISIASRMRGDGAAMLRHGVAALEAAAARDASRLITSAVIEVDPTISAMLRGGDLSHDARRMARGIRARASTVREPAAAALTKSELAVLGELCLGRGNKEIGRHLDLSENTVKFHLKHIFGKLGVNTRAAAVNHALRHGLVTLE